MQGNCRQALLIDPKWGKESKGDQRKKKPF